MHVEISLEYNLQLQNHAYRLHEGNKDCKYESSFKKRINAVHEGLVINLFTSRDDIQKWLFR